MRNVDRASLGVLLGSLLGAVDGDKVFCHPDFRLQEDELKLVFLTCFVTFVRQKICGIC